MSINGGLPELTGDELVDITREIREPVCSRCVTRAAVPA
jgi:hypothetical protein